MRDSSSELYAINNDSSFLEDPIEYNIRVIKFLDDKYGDYVKLVFNNLQNQIKTENAPWLKELLKPVPTKLLKRQIQPIFCAGSLTGGVTANHIRLCEGFIKAISLPVLSLDQSLDGSNEFVNNKKFASTKTAEFCSTYDGLNDIFQLPHGEAICKILLDAYYIIFSSLYKEYTERFKFSVIKNPLERCNSILKEQFSPLNCMYFATTTKASFLLNSATIDSDMLSMIQTFGPLRQLIDEIADVCEDVTMGKVSTPILFALSKGDKSLRDKIRQLWNIVSDNSEPNSKEVKRLSNEIKNLVQQRGGFDQAYALADLWYKQVIQEIERCTIHNKVTNELLLLFRLKRAFLERLKVTSWNDISISDKEKHW